MIRAYIAVYASHNVRIVTAAKQGWIKSAQEPGQHRTVVRDCAAHIAPIESACPDDAILLFKSATEVLDYAI